MLVVRPGEAPLKRVLVIDDQRDYRRDLAEFTFARSFDDGLHQIVQWMDGLVIFDEIWLDHDLGMDQNGVHTIRPIVLYIVEEALIFGYVISTTKFKVISSNPVGRDWIVSQLDEWYDIEVVV